VARLLRATLLALIALTQLDQTVGAAPAAAAGPGQAEELIRRGNELRQRGSDTRALPFFQQAYELSPTPRTAAQLGLVEMALGYQLDSERHLAEALASPHDLWIRKNRTVLEESISRVRQAIGEIMISGPAGAEVLVNGKAAGRLPLADPVRLGEGPNTVEVRALGFVPGRRSITVMGGKRERLVFDLQPEPVSSSATLHSDGPGAPGKGVPGLADKPDSGRSRRLLRPAAWIAAAGAVAFVGFGIVETARWWSRKEEFEQHTGARFDNPSIVGINCGAKDPSRGGQGCAVLYDRMQTAQTLAVLGYGVGAGLAIGSVFLFAASSTPQPDYRIACAPTWPQVGTTCRFAF
jgi:hypothetical protein